MKVISVVRVVFLTVCAVSANSVDPFKESRNSNGKNSERAVRENYTPVGCYRFKKLKRLQIFSNEAYKKTNATSGTPFDQCIPEAIGNNYEIIGIQKKHKNIFCRKGNEEQWKADDAIEKLDPNECEDDVGSRKSIFIYRKSQNPATCSANNKIYYNGDYIYFHNVTSPVEKANYTKCQCSYGSITDCVSRHCDFGQKGFPPEVCDNWITGQEGVGCPLCEACTTNAGPWVKRLGSRGCYECSCIEETLDLKCLGAITCLDCPGITVPVPGKCCPKCITTRRRDVTSRDEKFDGEEYDEMEQWKPRD